MPDDRDGDSRVLRAIKSALVGVAGSTREWTATAAKRDALRHHVLAYVHDYAVNRGVALSDADIIDELDAYVEELRVRGR